MLSIHNLSYYINEKKLFSNISISLLPSCIIYVKGPNGSGKTTFLRCVAGIAAPSSGNISINSVNINFLKKPYCAYIGHLNAYSEELSVYENLKFWSECYDSLELLEAGIFYFKLHDVLDTKYYKLSQGNKKKVALARLIACQCDLWLIDEADSNLDEENKMLLNNLIISKANNGGIILISSHNAVNSIKTSVTLDIADLK